MNDRQTSRTIALRVLVASEKGKWADSCLKRELKRNPLDKREAALCTRLCYGVLQNRRLLDFWLAPHSKIPLAKLEDKVRNILRMGAYQALMLDRIPGYAGVSSCVDLTRAISGDRASGFVNAVLRALLRSPRLLPVGAACERLSVLYSLPEWQVEEYLSLLGEQETEELLRTQNDTPPLWVQVNPLRCTAEGLRDALAAEGVKTQPHPWLQDCVNLDAPGDIDELDAFRKGMFLVADPAARLAVMAADPRPGMAVLDACAAPGGKAFLAAFAMGNKGEVKALDIHPHKLTLLRRGCERLGLSIVRPALRDASVFDPALENSADLVLADLPCSGMGILRKKPDIRNKTQLEVADLPALQLRLLTNLARYVRPGGVLLYITCSLRRAENEDVADAFQLARGDFSPLPFPLPEPVGGAPHGRITLWPHRHGTDGFFLAKFRRDLEGLKT